MAPPAPGEERRELVRRLREATSPRERRRLLSARRDLASAELVGELYGEVVRLARVDLAEADRLAEAAFQVAEDVGDEGCRALALRAIGHATFMRGRYTRALELYGESREIYARLGREVDEGRTLSASLQSLIYLGRYEDATAGAARAREIFERHGDRLRLARLDLNVANVLYRQDRFEEALELYERAYGELERLGEAQDVAVALRNIAVCRISLNDFAGALATYRRSRDYCDRQGMPLLVAEVDYNIAYLYYLRGEYTRAIELYQTARRLAEGLGDAYHAALCDLDQSEMFLELNLSEKGARLARRASEAFEALGMGYEAAKALLNLAIAAHHGDRVGEALELFGQARRRFVAEHNAVWPHLIDLYQALVLFEEDRVGEARGLAEGALAYFSRSWMATKAALAELLLARIELREARAERALDRATEALRRLETAETPALAYEACFVLGQVREALGEKALAYETYRRARGHLESLRAQIEGEELKIAFLEDKLAVYESLVQLALEEEPAGSRAEVAFSYVEEAKSRGLADLIAFRASSLRTPDEGEGQQLDRVRRLREELRWYYRRLSAEEVRPTRLSQREAADLSRRARECESELVGVLGELRDSRTELTLLQNAGTVSLERIRASLPDGTLLLEYYGARDRFYACLLDADGLDIVPLAPLRRVRDRFRLLQFQLSKFRLGSEYVKTFAGRLQEAASAHLAELYEDLVAPVRNRLPDRVVVVPHGFLHLLPFHALFDGERYLVDDVAISYAPSASVYSLCVDKPRRAGEESLILGIPDRQTPHIAEEVKAVAACLPNPRLLLGASATARCVRELGPRARFLHIATHGLFRRENPMLSSIRLGDSELSLFDLYQLDLAAELVTLSGCGTGLNVVVGGDELLGLVRGLLYAGARSVLGTLWDVSDESTSWFMSLFYDELRRSPDRSVALQRAMGLLRERYPHPYHWAPFVLVGETAAP